MANWFCDTQLATGGNNGTTMDDAWQNMETAFEYASYAAGDICWFRRRSSFSSPTSDIRVVADGTPREFIKFLGWPRAEEGAGAGDFIQGNRVIANISGITPDFEKHASRNLKNDVDGKYYMVTAVVCRINYNNETGTFTEGLIVTSAGAGAGVGKIHRLVDNGTTGILYVVVRSGTFGTGDAITDTSTGAASVNGAADVDNGLLIQNKYAGSDASTAALTLEVDEDYATAQAIVDTAWTIKKADYNGDPDDLPTVDFGANLYNFYPNNATCILLANLYFKGSTDTAGLFRITTATGAVVRHMLFTITANIPGFVPNNSGRRCTIENCIIVGSYTGSAQRGINNLYDQHGSYFCQFRNVAVYNMGNTGLHGITGHLENVTSGIALPNGSYDIRAPRGMLGRNISCGGANGDVYCSALSKLYIENWQHTVGVNKLWHLSGTAVNLTVVAGSGDPQKRTDGADKVFDLECTRSISFKASIDDPLSLFAKPLMIWAPTTSKTYRIYVQCKDMATTNWYDLYLEAEYIDAYHAGTGAYHTVRVQSDETLTLRSGATDWSQYIEVTGIQPAIEGWVKLQIKFTFQDSNGHAYIDPKVVIT